MPDHVYRIATKLRATESGYSFCMNTLVSEIRTGCDTYLGKLNTEARLPDHRAGELFASYDALVDVNMKRVSICLGTEFIRENFAGRHAALEELQRRIHLSDVLSSF